MIPVPLSQLDVATQDRYSDELPPGNYDGIWLRATGVVDSEEDIPDTIIGNIRLIADAPWGRGDVHNIQFNNLRLFNMRQGGVLEGDGTPAAVKFSAFLPASVFGFPSALWVPKGASVKVHVGACTDDVTSMNVEVAPVPYSPRPMNYLCQLSQNRYNALGGIAPTPLHVANLLALGLRPAETTEPVSVVLQGRRRSWTVDVESARAFSSWLWDVEAEDDELCLLPLFSADIGEAIGDTYKMVFSGGTGYLDYLMIQATMVPGAQLTSAQVVQSQISAGYADAGVIAPVTPQPGPTIQTDKLLRSGQVQL